MLSIFYEVSLHSRIISNHLEYKIERNSWGLLMLATWRWLQSKRLTYNPLPPPPFVVFNRAFISFLMISKSQRQKQTEFIACLNSAHLNITLSYLKLPWSLISTYFFWADQAFESIGNHLQLAQNPFRHYISFPNDF